MATLSDLLDQNCFHVLCSFELQKIRGGDGDKPPGSEDDPPPPPPGPG